MNENAVDQMSESSERIKQALLALTGVGLVSAAGITPSIAQAQASGVTITTVAPPENKQVQTPPQWKRVQIELTKEQQAALASQGVNTSKLDITTYNLNQLSGMMSN